VQVRHRARSVAVAANIAGTLVDVFFPNIKGLPGIPPVTQKMLSPKKEETVLLIH